MFRFVAFDGVFFLVPFVIYGLWLLATRRNFGGVEDWQVKTIAVLSLVGALVMLAAIALFIHFDRDPPGGKYVPAHIENGKIVPGKIVPPGQTP